MINLVGSTIQQYLILAKIRETPTRILYRVKEKQTGSLMAIEVVRPNKQLSPQKTLRLINLHAEKLAQLEHPNIARITEVGIQEELVFIVYAFIPKQVFKRRLKQIFSWEEMAIELASIAEVLSYAHNKGVFHGSLIPASIILDNNYTPRLFDFGVEQLLTTEILSRLPGKWRSKWSSEYSPLEQSSNGIFDARTDIYSLGIIMHEWMAGTPNLKAVTGLESQLNNWQERKLTREANKAEHYLAWQFIQKCTAKYPADRYQSMQEVFAILAHGVLRKPITSQVLQTPLAHLGVPKKVGVAWIVVSLILLMVISGALWLNTNATNNISVNFTNTVGEPSMTSASDIVASITSDSESPSQSPSPDPSSTNLPSENQVLLPVFQGTPISAMIDESITVQSISRISPISRWGMGLLTDLSSSPTGEVVAAASTSGIFVFDARDLTLEKYLDTRTAVSAVKFSPNGKLMAAGLDDGLLQIWDTSNWQELLISLNGHSRLPLLDLEFSLDSSKLVSLTREEVLIWTIGESTHATPILESSKQATTVTFSIDNKYVVIGGNDANLKVWDVESLTLLDTISYFDKVVEIKPIPQSSLFIVGSKDRSVAVLDITNGAIEPLGKLLYPLSTVAVSPSGNLLAAGDIIGGIFVWDSRTLALKWSSAGSPTNQINQPLFGKLHTLIFNHDGSRLFSGLQKAGLRILDANSGNIQGENRDLDVYSSKMAISHNSHYLISQNSGAQLSLWDISTGIRIHQYSGRILDGDPFSPDDHWLAVAGDRNIVNVIDVATGTSQYSFRENQGLRVIQFVANGSQLATGKTSDIHLWSLTSGQELETKSVFPYRGCETIANARDQHIFSITPYFYIVKDNQDRQRVTSLCEFSSLNWSVYVSEANSLLAFGGESKLAIIHTQVQPLQPVDLDGVNQKNILQITISPNGQILAATLYDKLLKEFTIEFWSLETLKSVITLRGFNFAFTELQFTPDGKHLILASEDGTIQIWGIPTKR